LENGVMRGLVVVLGALLAAPGLAETLYVTDILRLGIHQASDTSDKAFSTLVSGTPLEILERSSNYARVRPPDGREGWVKSAYLVDEKPSRLRATELEAEVSQLEDDKVGAIAAREVAEQALADLQAAIAADAGSATALRLKNEELATENDSYRDRMDAFRGSVPLSWGAIALVVALVAGFLAGLWWLDFQSRRRHGGFRVY
jgi:SH3 domain protein